MSALIPPTRLAAIAAGVVVIVFGLLLLADRGCSRKVAEQTRAADVAKGEAIGHAEQAAEADARAEQNTDALENLKAEKDSLLAELGRLRAKVHTPDPDEIPDPLGSEPDAGLGVDRELVEPGLTDVVHKQDEVIRAQAAYITRLEDQASTLTNARDHWKSAFEAEERRAVALEIALKAQKSAGTYRSAKWGLLGVAVGFVGGRL